MKDPEVMGAFQQDAVLEAIPDRADVVMDPASQFFGGEVSLHGALLVVHRQRLSRIRDAC